MLRVCNTQKKNVEETLVVRISAFRRREGCWVAVSYMPRQHGACESHHCFSHHFCFCIFLSSDWDQLATILSVRAFIVTSLPLLEAANSSSSFHLSSEVLVFSLLIIFESLLNPIQVLFFLNIPFQFRSTKLDTVPWEFLTTFEFYERKISHLYMRQTPFHITLDDVCFPEVQSYGADWLSDFYLLWPWSFPLMFIYSLYIHHLLFMEFTFLGWIDLGWNTLHCPHWNSLPFFLIISPLTQCHFHAYLPVWPT